MASFSNLKSALKESSPGLRLLDNVPMSEHTSLRIGGPARLMALPSCREELMAALKCAKESGLRTMVIGRGSNLLVSDEALNIFVIKLSDNFADVELTGECEITAACGVSLYRLARFACEKGLSGLEFAHGIPGTLGGAVYMNAGAYGGQMSDVVERTCCIAPESLCLRWISGNEHGYGYRKSCFEGTENVIVQSVLRLKKDDPEAIEARMMELADRRRASQPLNLPSAGSTFKRPAVGYAAEMIDKSGLKGYRVGGAEVSEKHAGFVVNVGDASFDDVLAVMKHVQETVLKNYGVELEPEVKIIRA